MNIRPLHTYAGAPRRAPEAGLTGIEVVVSLVLFGLVTSGIVGVLWSVRDSVDRFHRDQLTREAVSAVRAVRGGIRSGAAVYPPTEDGMSLVVGSGDPGGPERCVQWRIVGVALERRAWPSDWPTAGGVGPWHVVTGDVVNRAPPDMAAVPAFALSASANDIAVSILVNNGVDASGTVRVSRRVEASSVSSRGRCSEQPPP